MKKYLIVTMIFITFVVLIGYVSYKAGFDSGVKDGLNVSEQSSTTEIPEKYIDRVDYPLIDIAFNDGNEWIIVIADGIYTEKPTYRVCENGKELQFNKEFLSVVTYPAGRGTTGNGCISVYKNGQLNRSIEYFHLNFSDEALENSFKEINVKELKYLIEK